MHGGRLREAAQHYQIPLANWLDLSTGINPVAYPIPHIPTSVWNRLPEEEDDLIALACRYYHAPNALPVAGSQAAIQALPQLYAKTHVGILHPSYTEHAHAWQNAGHWVHLLKASEIEKTLPKLTVLVLVNPNNPTGECISPAQLLNWQSILLAKGGTLIVDEAFMDITPSLSVASYTHLEGLIVLRSLGKFFGLAGARVGFVLASEALLHALSTKLGPWCVNHPARYVASVALADVAWQSATREQLLQKQQRLFTLLTDQGLAPHGGCALFQWLRHEKACVIYDQLARQGILLRLFEAPYSLRFGLPENAVQWQRLEQALTFVVK